ncbi:TPA: hypothetical protein ACH3X3_007760 [Trebouxia sp. C0006]
MPSQEYAPQEDVTLSPGETASGNKRKAPEGNFADDEEVSCPCGAGPCALLTSTKPQSQGRKFYRCPKPQGEGQCGFFRFQDQPAEKARKPSNYAQASDGGTGYEGTAEGDKPPGGGSQALQCHCGQDAVEITSHSAANPDRVFYKCPKTQAEGRCRFFKWQDELGNGPTALQQQPGPAVPSPQRPNKSEGAPAAAAGGSGVFADEGDDFDDNFGFGDAGNTDAGAAAPSPYANHAPASYQQGQQQGQQQGFGGAPTSPGGVQPPEVLNCSCNLQCSYIMAKTAKNDGRWFYRCPKPQEEGQCRFFQWADELGQQPPPSAGRGGGGGQYTRPPPAAAPYAAHTYSSPTKMGAGTGGAAPSSDTCFKCGQAGHWSRDCPNGGGGGGGVAGGGGGSSGACFKCGQEGHWSRDCPNPGSGGGRGGGGRGFGGRGSSGYGGGDYGGSSGYGGSRGGGGGGARGGGAGGAAATGACYKCGQPGHWSTACPN